MTPLNPEIDNWALLAPILGEPHSSEDTEQSQGLPELGLRAQAPHRGGGGSLGVGVSDLRVKVLKRLDLYLYIYTSLYVSCVYTSVCIYI